jgi:hypothetical protein
MPRMRCHVIRRMGDYFLGALLQCDARSPSRPERKRESQQAGEHVPREDHTLKHNKFWLGREYSCAPKLLES